MPIRGTVQKNKPGRLARGEQRCLARSRPLRRSPGTCFTRLPSASMKYANFESVEARQVRASRPPSERRVRFVPSTLIRQMLSAPPFFPADSSSSVRPSGQALTCVTAALFNSVVSLLPSDDTRVSRSSSFREKMVVVRPSKTDPIPLLLRNGNACRAQSFLVHRNGVHRQKAVSVAP